MPTSQSFVDLRTSSLNAGSHTDDSVWPSFTDIMTVVVMIFLMALVVILLRNVELVKSEQEAARLAELKGSENVKLEQAVTELEQRIAQIQIQLQAQVLKTEESDQQLAESREQINTLIADIQALQLLREKLSDENTQLAAAKLALEGRLKIVEQEKTDVEELKQQAEQANLVIEDEKQQLIIQLQAAMSDQLLLGSTLSQQKSDIEALEQEKESALSQAQSLGQEKQAVIVQIQGLEQEKSQLTEQAQETQSEFDALKAVYSILQKDNRSLLDRISDAERMVAELEANVSMADITIDQQQQELTVAEDEIQSKTEEIQTKTEQLTQTQEQLTALERKYLELVGPARSELNKYVVKVSYRRLGDQNVIGFGLPGESQLRPITQEELHRRLTQLKQEKGDELYTRIVIPNDSGLSYDQAWRFTNDILTKYDYYYQEN